MYGSLLIPVKREVMRQAVEAGADLINDVRAPARAGRESCRSSKFRLFDAHERSAKNHAS